MFVFDLGWQLYLGLMVVLLLLPALGLAVVYFFHPRSLRLCLWTMALSCLLFLGLCLKLNDNTIQLTDQTLELRAGLYQMRIDNLHSAHSKMMLRFCDELAEFEPVELISGISLPHYKVGWYTLANQQQAFVMIIGQVDRVTVIRTDDSVTLVGGDLNHQQGGNLQMSAFW